MVVKSCEVRMNKKRSLIFLLKLYLKIYLRWVKYQHKKAKYSIDIEEHNRLRDIEFKKEFKHWIKSIKELFLALLACVPGCGCLVLVLLFIINLVFGLLTGEIVISSTTIIIILLILILLK